MQPNVTVFVRQGRSQSVFVAVILSQLGSNEHAGFGVALKNRHALNTGAKLRQVRILLQVRDVPLISVFRSSVLIGKRATLYFWVRKLTDEPLEHLIEFARLVVRSLGECVQLIADVLDHVYPLRCLRNAMKASVIFSGVARFTSFRFSSGKIPTIE